MNTVSFNLLINTKDLIGIKEGPTKQNYTSTLSPIFGSNNSFPCF